jgi:16S rRNA (uracil1498-N3)-methyltransferase
MQRDQPHQFLHYSATFEQDARQCDLKGDEHQHVSRVLRMRPGEEVFVTNGRGAMARCRIRAIKHDKTTLDVTGIVDAEVSRRRITLAAACLKKEAFEQVVRQCTELGVTRFVPFVAEKSHVRSYSRSFYDRLHRISVAAMKQSFRAVLPEVDPVAAMSGILDMVPRFDDAIVGSADAPTLDRLEASDVLLVIGPEGGLVEAEIDALRNAGCTIASAVPGRLRAETAAVALVTCALRAPAGRIDNSV